MSAERIPFNRPYSTGAELDYIREAIGNGHLSGNGPFSERCARWLEASTGAARALMTPSCTAALEAAALLLQLEPGDEVIMPSYTFVSTANAFVLRAAVPVFVDIRPDTLNLDESRLEEAVSPRTRAIVAVHYAGVGCEMEEITQVARRHGLAVIEDAAQGIFAKYHGSPLGSFGALAAFSFHETKNVMCGEGGALGINDPQLVDRAEIIQEKGTNRRRFFRGQIDKYSWVDLGSSYVLSDLEAAFLWAQLEAAQEITRRRRAIWNAYDAAFEEVEQREQLRRPYVPQDCEHNAHLYYVLLPDEEIRDRFITRLDERGIHAVFHYVPLHSSLAGRSFGRAAGSLSVTDNIAGRLVRLPLWVGMTDVEVERVVDAVYAVMHELQPARR